MRQALIFLPLLLAGCGSITRAEYESGSGLPILSESEKDGTTTVVYGPTNDPRIDPATGIYTCPEGVRVAKYRNGSMTARWFQEHAEVKP